MKIKRFGTASFVLVLSLILLKSTVAQTSQPTQDYTDIDPATGKKYTLTCKGTQGKCFTAHLPSGNYPIKGILIKASNSFEIVP